MDDDRAVDALLRAHGLGGTVYDTSDIYGLGHSQRLLGRMLAQVPRESVRITCKVGAFKGTGVNAYSSLNLHGQVEQSMENLRVDYLDVLTLHHTDFGPRDRYLEEALETLQALRDLGSVKAIGMQGPTRLVTDQAASASCVSNRESAARFAFLFQRIRPEVICTPFNPLSRELEAVDGEEDEVLRSLAG
ncbi:aldo/keto reductase [Streptomyces sp. NPDC002870]|uniref:aldo/keto reductase n=1 Tax=Streptomyces sp. NPDC002870 TaxID=3364666 RepID=UPI003681B0CB